MEVYLNEKYAVTSDYYNYILNTVSIVQSGEKKGQTRLKPIKYFGTVESLLKELVQLEIRNVDSINELKDTLEYLELMIEELPIDELKKL